MSEPKLWLTSMSGPGSFDNIYEMISPILPLLDGVIWILHDCPVDDPGAVYLESIKGQGRIIHRTWPQRHWHSMNETLFTGLMEEGDYVIWSDPLERPKEEFLSQVKTKIGPTLRYREVGCVYYYGKPFLFPYLETLEYRMSPHWTLTGWSGNAIEWSQVEPDESKVRFNARPLKRLDPKGFVWHYLRYYVAYPAGSNTCALGIEQYAKGVDHQTAFQNRESLRLDFRREMKRRGYPLTLEGAKLLLGIKPDEILLWFLQREKILSDAYHLLNGRGDQIKDTHNPSDAIPIV